jgi:hypothetical protein
MNLNMVLLGAQSRKCIFLMYSNTFKSYQLYNEENKKFVVSRDVFFLEFDKDASIVDTKLNNLDRFSSKKFFYEWDNDLPHPEGGIHILDQSGDFPCVTTPKNEEKLFDNNDSMKENWLIIIFWMKKNWMIIMFL